MTRKRTRQLWTVLITTLLVTTVLGPLAAASATVDADTAASASLGDPPPGGFVGVPDSNVREDLPSQTEDTTGSRAANLSDVLGKADLAGSVMTTRGADTLEVTITTRARALARGNAPDRAVPPDHAAPELALVLSDDVEHSGRAVAIPAAPFKDALGFRPDYVFGLHESGERWRAPVDDRGGTLVFEVPKFSTNTVTFTSTVELTGSPATDGTQYRYDVSNLDTVDNYSVALEGVETTEAETASASNLAGGDSLALDVAGNQNPTGPSSNNNPEVTFTGEGFSRQDSASASGLADGDSVSLGVDGNLDPVGPDGSGDPEVTFTGEGFSRWDNHSGTEVAAGSSYGLDVDGNVEPTGPGPSGEPTVEITGTTTTRTSWGGGTSDNTLMFGNYSGTLYSSEMKITNPPTTVSEVTAHVDSGGSNDPIVDVYIHEGGPNGNFGDGTLVASDVTVPVSSGNQTIDVSTFDVSDGASAITVEFVTQSSTPSDSHAFVSYDGSLTNGIQRDNGGNLDSAPAVYATSQSKDITVSTEGSGTHTIGTLDDGETSTVELDMAASDTSLDVGGSGIIDYDLRMTERQGSEDPAVDVDGDGLDDVTYSGILMDGETATYAAPELSTSSTSADVSLSRGTVATTVEWTERQGSDSPSLDVDGDGSPEASHSGVLMSGETATYELPTLTADDGPATVGLDSGTVAAEVAFTERTVTEDVAVAVNDGTATYDGQLAAGDTASLSPNTTWVREGTNRVNVTVADHLSADAPEPSVGLTYRHDAAHNKTVAYDGQKWQERYNVTETFASERVAANATVPFVQEVYSVRTVEVRFNQSGEWTSVADANHQFDGTDLTVDLVGAYGGPLPADTTAEVRATGSKVVVNNGSIAVSDPSAMGEPLDTTFTVESWGEGAYIAVGGTPDGDRLHYVASASHNADAWVEWTADGKQRLELPNVAAGHAVTVRTTPLEVAPDTGEVHLQVVDPDQPEWRVRPGANPDDPVLYRYHNTSTGETYILQSTSTGVQRDSGEASSPVELWDDDSGETLAIFVDDSDSGSVGPGGGDEDSPPGPTGDGVTASVGSLLYLLVPAVLLAAVWFLSQEYGDGTVSTRILFIGEAGLLALLALETLSPASLVGGVAEAIVTFAANAGEGLGAAMPLVVLASAGLIYYWLRQRGKPDTVIQIPGRQK